MKKALVAVCLLLILTAVSTGPGIAWAATTAQGLHVSNDPSGLDPAAPADEIVDLMGDPDDAITGNRGNGYYNEGNLINEPLSGLIDPGDFDVDDQILLMQVLSAMGLI